MNTSTIQFEKTAANVVQELVELMADYENFLDGPEWLLRFETAKKNIDDTVFVGRGVDVCNGLVSAMECQLKRKAGLFHLSQEAMMHQWSAATNAARIFLISCNQLS